MDAVCACLELHDSYWLRAARPKPVPCSGR